MVVAAELQRRVPGRRVRVFERDGQRCKGDEAGRRVCAWVAGGRGQEEREFELFDGFIEVECGGGGAWLGMRVRLGNAPSVGRCVRTVQGVHWYQEGGRIQLASTVAVEKESETEIDVGQGDEAVVELLEATVTRVLAKFRAANAQALNALDAPRAKFEYKLLQHHRGLDVVVATDRGGGRQHVLFALPLLAGESVDTPHGEDGIEGGSYLPRALPHPSVERGSSRTIIALRLVGVDDTKDNASAGDVSAWDVSLSWAGDLRLSSQVTLMAHAASDGASSVDIIASCKQAFLTQWIKRRDFVGELRTKVIVLEFDPVDFSRVFFMLQEQLDPSAPLRVLVLSLAFTPEFFPTRSLADLRVRLLDGRGSNSIGTDGGVAITLVAHAAETVEVWEHDTPRLVDEFLSCLQSALVQHLYE